ncbi:hypothetical protein ACP4OV_012604 [Aristida adscensionis]
MACVEEPELHPIKAAVLLIPQTAAIKWPDSPTSQACNAAPTTPMEDETPPWWSFAINFVLPLQFLFNFAFYTKVVLVTRALGLLFHFHSDNL